MNIIYCGFMSPTRGHIKLQKEVTFIPIIGMKFTLKEISGAVIGNLEYNEETGFYIACVELYINTDVENIEHNIIYLLGKGWSLK